MGWRFSRASRRAAGLTWSGRAVTGRCSGPRMVVVLRSWTGLASASSGIKPNANAPASSPPPKPPQPGCGGPLEEAGFHDVADHAALVVSYAADPDRPRRELDQALAGLHHAWRHSRAGCRAIGSLRGSLGGALEDSGYLGQQVSASARELAHRPRTPHRLSARATPYFHRTYKVIRRSSCRSSAPTVAPRAGHSLDESANGSPGAGSSQTRRGHRSQDCPDRHNRGCGHWCNGHYRRGIAAE